MPTYEYQCNACGEVFEVIQKITEDPIQTCEKCGSEQVKRLISASAFHLKGSGWYKSDYASSNNKSDNAVKKEASTSENKTDSKKEAKSNKSSETKSTSTSTKE